MVEIESSSGRWAGGFIVERHVRSEEVVVGNKQCSKRDSAVEGIEAIGRFDMMFIGSI